MNGLVVPLGIEALEGDTAIDERIAGVTVSVTAGLVTPSRAAVIGDVPAPIPVDSPVGEIVATEGVPELHVTCGVRSAVVPSE
jgi:hypothetical protein